MNVSEIITNEIIAKLKDGIVPWEKPFVGVTVPAMNFKTKKRYNGVNMVLLYNSGYISPYWLTYKQAQELEGQVRKGSKGHRILFAKMVKYTNDEGEEKEKAVYKYSTVFNLDNIDGIDCPYTEKVTVGTVDEFEYIDNCKELIEQFSTLERIPSIIEHELLKAWYEPMADIIKTCPPNYYKENYLYYSTLFHEIIHSTGHKSRLERDMKGFKGDQRYAKEELVAEIGACFLCGMTGIKTKTIDNQSAYIQGWLEVLNNDPNIVISASSHAQKAVEFLTQNIEIQELVEDES